MDTTQIQKKYESLSDAQKPQFKKAVILNILNTNYGGKIQNLSINNSPSKGAIVSGKFETPRLGGKPLIMAFSISKDSCVLSPQNLEVLDNSEREFVLQHAIALAFSEGYVPLEYYDFAQKELNCVKGWSCRGKKGFGCLSKEKKNCKNALNNDHKTYVGWLQHQININPNLHQDHIDEANKLGISKTTTFINNSPPTSVVKKTVKVRYDDISKKDDSSADPTNPLKNLTYANDKLVAVADAAAHGKFKEFNGTIFTGGIDRLSHANSQLKKIDKDGVWKTSDDNQLDFIKELFAKGDAPEVKYGSKIAGILVPKEVVDIGNALIKSSLETANALYSHTTESAKNKWAEDLLNDGDSLQDIRDRSRHSDSKNIYDDLANRGEELIKSGKVQDLYGEIKSTSSSTKNNALPQNNNKLDQIKNDMSKKFGANLVSDAEKSLQNAVNKSSIFIRTQPDVIDSIIKEGFTTPYQREKVKEYSYQYFRQQDEQEFFGIKGDAKPDEYPTYGYFAENPTQNGLAKANKYGEIVIKLKDKTKEKATASGGDSLSGIYPSNAKKINAASLMTADQRDGDRYDDHTKQELEDLAKSKNVDDVYKAIKQPYIEAQLHGGISADDIEEIQIPKGFSFSNQSLQKIKKLGIKVTEVE